MNAYDLKALPALGINVGQLGCVMLDVQAVDLADVIPDGWAYHSQHPDRRWISGVQTGAQHITLLYGLLSNAHLIREHVEEVLAGWQPGDLTINRLDGFPSPFPGEDYVCLVGRLGTENAYEPAGLVDAHQRLSLLPHIDTHSEYKPHVTLAYVRSEFEGPARRALARLLPAQLAPIGLNYGYEPVALDPQPVGETAEHTGEFVSIPVPPDDATVERVANIEVSFKIAAGMARTKIGPTNARAVLAALAGDRDA